MKDPGMNRGDGNLPVLNRLDRAALDTILREVRSHKAWLDRPVPDGAARSLRADEMGADANNSNPARILFLRSQEAKDRLIPALNEGNITKVRAVLVTAIIAYETRFYEDWGRFFPYDYSAGFVNDAAKADKTALRNSSLQAPISSSLRGHWDWTLEQRLDSRTKGSTGHFSLAQASNLLCNIGHGDPTALAPRAARYDFAEVCTIL